MYLCVTSLGNLSGGEIMNFCLLAGFVSDEHNCNRVVFRHVF